MNRIAELPVVNAEPIADVLRRIALLIPDDASHAWAYSPRVDQSSGLGFPTPAQIYFKSRQLRALALMRRTAAVTIQSETPPSIFRTVVKPIVSGDGDLRAFGLRHNAVEFISASARRLSTQDNRDGNLRMAFVDQHRDYDA